MNEQHNEGWLDFEKWFWDLYPPKTNEPWWHSYYNDVRVHAQTKEHMKVSWEAWKAAWNTRHQPAIDPKRDELQSELASLRAVVEKMTNVLERANAALGDNACSQSLGGKGIEKGYYHSVSKDISNVLTLAASHGVDKNEEGELQAPRQEEAVYRDDPPFGTAMKRLINYYGKECPSNTADWILAEYLEACLIAFNIASLHKYNSALPVAPK